MRYPSLTSSVRVFTGVAVAAAVVVVAVLIVAAYSRELRRGRDRLAALHARVAAVPLGTIEYLQEGEGPTVLVSHGITGGVDQARGLAATYLGPGYRLVLPSRFGYLGSSMPADASPALQAEAFVQLLDSLGIARAIVLGNSAGGTAALHFAINYPERCRGLVLVSSGLSGGGSDHMSFTKRNVPALFFHSGLHEDYHKVSDEASLIDAGKIARVSGLVFRTAWSLAGVAYEATLSGDDYLLITCRSALVAMYGAMGGSVTSVEFADGGSYSVEELLDAIAEG